MKRLMMLFVLLAFPLMASAQSRYTPSELDTLVSTIALYPDPLLVHVLDASVHVQDIPSAYAFARTNSKLKGDDLAYAIERAELNYDESVIALIPFPDVLHKMSKYATWTKQLGEAVDMQKADVMDAVQRMRKVAHKNGYLNSDDKVEVTVDDNVVIQPVREEYVYVPEYDPRVVYYVVSDDHFRIRYVNGTWIGAGLVYWGWDPFGYDWVHRRPYYRHPRRYAPPPRHRYRHPRRRFGDAPPPPPPAHRRRSALPPSSSIWHTSPRSMAPSEKWRTASPQSANYSRPESPPPSRSLNKRQESGSRFNSSTVRPSAPLPPPPPRNMSNGHAAPPPPANYRRPAPPPASNSDNDGSRWGNRSHGGHNPPPPPPSRRRK